MKSIVLRSFVSAVLLFSSQASAHHAAAVLYHLDRGRSPSKVSSRSLGLAIPMRVSI